MDSALKDAYEHVIEPVDPVAVIVTCASGGDLAGCLVTFSHPCSIEPPRYAAWLSRHNRTYRVALRSDELIVHLLTYADLPLAELFGGVSGTGKFSRVPWSDRDGTPLLRTSGGWLRGRILSRSAGLDQAGGDHVCFVLEPVEASDCGNGGRNGGRPLRHSDVRHITPGQPVGSE
jgi:flavin reductase (DIM6/NTAB) family NADH-FMN oxidoreductase RutF